MAAYNDLLLSGRGSRLEADEDCGSFWESGNFGRTTQRVEDGRRLCQDLVDLLKERADIEKDYAKQLHGWADKWRDIVEKGPEYGTTVSLWKGFLTEAEKLADLHLSMKDKLCKDVIEEVKDWKKDAYHKSMFQIKEKKEMEAAFKKAQQPWVKLFKKVEDAKSQYYKAVRNQRSAANQLSNALADADVPMSHVKMIRGHSIESKCEVNKAKGKYERALRDIHFYNPKYIEDMSAVFDKAQEMEGQRLEFFKKIMFSVYKCLDLSQNPSFQEIYQDFSAVIENADPKEDLQWWSRMYGAHMDMKWPVFEEYKEEVWEIVKGKSNTEGASGTTLINWRAVEDLNESSLKSEESAHDQPDNIGKKTSKAKEQTNRSAPTSATYTRCRTNPFEEDDSDNDAGEMFVDCGGSNSSASIL